MAQRTEDKQSLDDFPTPLWATRALIEHVVGGQTYGEHFAQGRRKDMMLKTLLDETGVDSLHAYLRKRQK